MPKQPQPGEPPLRSDPLFLCPVVLCVSLHVMLLISAIAHNAAYLHDYRKNRNPDARHYVVEGENFWTHGEFSRCDAPPLIPDMLRTPVYPLFAGLFTRGNDPIALYIAQALLNVASCGLVFVIGKCMFSRAAGCIASLLFATDMMSAISAFEAMSEVAFTFLLLAATVVLLRDSANKGTLPTLASCALSGVLLAGATLTRPAGLYAAILICCTLIAYGLATRTTLLAAKCSIALLLCFAVPVLLWVARNKMVFDLARLSTADAIMTVYFAGAGAYQVKHGIDLERAQEMISREYNLPSPTLTNNHWATDTSVKEMDERLRSAQAKVLLKYPIELVKSSSAGVIKAHISHNIQDLGEMIGIPWNRSFDESNASFGRISRMFDNHPLLLIALSWQMLHTLVTWALFAVGASVIIFRYYRELSTYLIAALLAYLLLTVALVGKEAYYRSRTPHMPLVYVVGGAAVQLLAKSRKQPAA